MKDIIAGCFKRGRLTDFSKDVILTEEVDVTHVQTFGALLVVTGFTSIVAATGLLALAVLGHDDPKNRPWTKRILWKRVFMVEGAAFALLLIGALINYLS